MKVDFLIVGTQKGGTTALASFLRRHPQIGMSKKKEVHFFDRDRHFRKKPVDYEKYHKHFREVENHKIIGEKTPIYMYWKTAPQRIYEYNPKMKLIFTLRNPVERAYSHWIMTTKVQKKDTWPFPLAIRFEKLRCLTAYPHVHRVFSYVDRGYYTKQIKRMLKYFPMEQMLFIRNEDLRERPAEILNRIFEFLGVDIVPLETSVVFSQEYQQMKRKDRMYLLKKYKKEIKELESMLGWDCRAWKKLNT